MGIYRTLLEDEVTYLDDNNDGAASMEELMDAVDNQEINVDEVENAQSAEFDETKDADEIMEEATMALAESEMAWNMMMEDFAIAEASRANSGVLTESMDDIKNWFKNAIEKVKEFFKKVWQVIQRWASNITSMIMTDKKFVEKNRAKIEAGYKVIKADKSKWKEGYPFSGLDEAVKKITNYESDDNYKTMSDIMNRLDDAIFTSRSSAINNLADEKKYSEKEDMKKNIYGESKEMVMDAKDVIAILSDKGDTKKVIKKAADGAKKSFNKWLKALKNAEKKVSTKKSDEYDNDTSERYKLIISANNAIKRMQTEAQNCRNLVLGAIKKQKHQARAFGNLYVRAANKDKYKGFQNESGYGYLSGLNLI